MKLKPGDIFLDADKLAWVREAGERETVSLVFFYNDGIWPDELIKAIANNECDTDGDSVSGCPMDVPRKPWTRLIKAKDIS